MKATVLILLWMSSWCWGLQPGLEYQYRYSGRVATGITDVRHQFSAAGIQADITVQVSEEYSAIVQFSNVEVGDFHGDITCDIREPLPIEYHHLEEGIELLEKPFRVEGHGSRVFDYLEVPNEPVWITNIRKAVINIFRISPFVIVGEERGSELLDFSAHEDTIFGFCTTWYNVYKLPEDEAAKENHQRENTMETDVQREEGSSSSSTSKGAGKGRKTAGGRKGTKTSHGRKGASKTSKSGRTDSRAHSVDDTLWGLHRTVDFEECKDLVAMKGHVAPSTEDLISRSSIGTYLIRGDTNAFRLERAFIEGSITLFTQEDHQEHFDTFTNQTIELKAVRTIEEQLTIEYDVYRFESWHYEVEQSLVEGKVEGVQPSLEQILTGVNLTEDTVTEIKGMINKGIQDLSDWMSRIPAHTTNLVSEMSHVVDAISILNYQQIEGIYNQYVTEYREATSLQSDSEAQEFHSRKIFLLKQAVYAAGTDSATHFLLDKLNDEEFRNQDHEALYDFFLHLKYNIKTPSYIPKIMEVVMQMEWGNRQIDDKAVALISFSKLVNKMCLSADRRSTYWDTTCHHDHICPVDLIINTYIPYLQQELENEELPQWHRLICIQALAGLGTSHTISIMQPYILGAKTSHIAFRKRGIWSTAKFHTDPTAKGKVMEILMTVFNNVAEHHEIRSTAFLIMTTWEDNLSWWQQMAAVTWRDPSHKLANFISSTIKTVAHMQGGGTLSERASRVEHLVKPVAPSSLTLSTNYYLLELIHSQKHGMSLSFAMLANMESVVPSQILALLRTANFLGIKHQFKVSLEQFNLDQAIIAFWHLFAFKERPFDGTVLDIIDGMYSELMENLGLERPKERPEMAIIGKVDKLIRLIYTSKTGLYYFLDNRIPRHYPHLVGFHPRYFNYLHYNRFVDTFLAIPTDLGLPYIAKHTAQNAWWPSYSGTPSHPRGVKGNTNIILDGNRMLYVEAKTLVPWSKKFAVSTTSHNVISILLPFKIGTYSHREHFEIQFTSESLINDQFKLIEAFNYPSTVQHGAFPTIVHYENNDVKIIQKSETCQYSHVTDVLPSTLGLRFKSEWHGDIPFPFSIRGIYKDEFNVFTPTLQTWNYHLTYDPEASTTKSLTITFIYVSTDKTLSYTDQYTDEFTGQTQGDYSDYSQFSQSSSDYQILGEPDEDVEGPSPNLERITKIQNEVLPATGGHVRSVSIDFSFRGEPSKEYEAILTWATGALSSKNINKFQFTWIEDVPQGVLAETHAKCFNVHFEKPNFLPFSSREYVLSADLHSTVKADFRHGVDCREDPVLEIEGSLEVTKEQLDDVRQKMTDDRCDRHPRYTPFDIITSPIYDHVSLKAHWTEALPIHLKNLTYYGYDLIRGIYFPDVSLDYTATNPDHEVEIDASKCLDSQLWTIYASKPNEVSIIEDVESPYLFDIFASPARIRDTLMYDFLNGREPSACIIDHEKIRTYDGLVIPYEPDSCWNVIRIDITGQLLGSIEVRFHDDQWEARVLHRIDGFLLEMTKSSLKKNGEDYNGDDDRFDFIFMQDAAILTLNYITNGFLKITNDRVFYLERQSFRSSVGGVCGNFDGEISAEMVGPKGCVYTDPDLFVKSWTNKGEGCSGFAYLGKKRPVEAYQDACPRKSYVPTGITYPNTLNDCTEWEYQERTEGKYKCKAITPTPKCKPGCSAIYPTSIQIKYDCVVTDESSHYYNECYPHEYMTHYPGSCIRH